MGRYSEIVRLVKPGSPNCRWFPGNWNWNGRGVGVLTEDEIPNPKRSNPVQWGESLSSGDRAIQNEIIHITSQNRESTLTRVRFQSGLNYRRNYLIFAHHKSNWPCAPQHRHADQKPIALALLIFLLLVKQHFFIQKSQNLIIYGLYNMNLGVDADAAVVPALPARSERQRNESENRNPLCGRRDDH